MMSIFSFVAETAALILLVLFVVSLASGCLSYCIVPCWCKIYKMISSARLQEMERREDLKIRLKQKYLASVGKETAEMAEALSPTICKMAESGAPADCTTDVTRSALGTQTNQGENNLSNLILEALKALPAILKKIRDSSLLIAGYF